MERQHKLKIKKGVQSTEGPLLAVCGVVVAFPQIKLADIHPSFLTGLECLFVCLFERKKERKKMLINHKQTMLDPQKANTFLCTSSRKQ